MNQNDIVILTMQVSIVMPPVLMGEVKEFRKSSVDQWELVLHKPQVLVPTAPGQAEFKPLPDVNPAAADDVVIAYSNIAYWFVASARAAGEYRTKRAGLQPAANVMPPPFRGNA